MINMQMMQALTQLKNNPMEVLKQFGIPQNMANDPQSMVQNLMNRGVVTQDQFNNAMNMAKQMGFKF